MGSQAVSALYISSAQQFGTDRCSAVVDIGTRWALYRAEQLDHDGAYVLYNLLVFCCNVVIVCKRELCDSGRNGRYSCQLGLPVTGNRLRIC